jgi:hypothetical protein
MSDKVCHNAAPALFPPPQKRRFGIGPTLEIPHLARFHCASVSS